MSKPGICILIINGLISFLDFYIVKSYIVVLVGIVCALEWIDFLFVMRSV